MLTALTATTATTMRPAFFSGSFLALLFSLTTAQSLSFDAARSLSFVRPRLDTLSTNEAGTPQLRAGDNITIEWDTDFEFTTLIVYQNVGRNLFQSEVLARTYTTRCSGYYVRRS